MFESVPCSRCGGSGQYSYCQMYGTTCFKCRGRKAVLTARGEAAQRFYVELLSKRTEDLVPGDKILSVDPMSGRSSWHVITDIYLQSEERRGGAWSLNPDGSPNYHGYVIECEDYTLHAEPQMHRIAHSAEEKKAAMEKALQYQETLTKQGTPRRVRVSR
jgi:hypothetical protein